MFRELIRKKQRLSEEECVQVLQEQTRGVLSVLGEDGYPYGMPMNHYYNPDDGCVYFHCGLAGHRVDALGRCDKVSFCVYDQGYRRDGEWALNVRSVIVFGRMQMLTDAALIADITARLSRKFTQDEAYIRREIEGGAHHTLLLRLVPEHICGKKVVEA